MATFQPFKERTKKRIWVCEHRGELSRIARNLGVSVSAVHAVLYYNLPSSKDKNFHIERALADAGAPYMKERLQERIEEQERCA